MPELVVALQNVKRCECHWIFQRRSWWMLSSQTAVCVCVLFFFILFSLQSNIGLKHSQRIEFTLLLSGICYSFGLSLTIHTYSTTSGASEVVSFIFLNVVHFVSLRVIYAMPFIVWILEPFDYCYIVLELKCSIFRNTEFMYKTHTVS